MATSGTINGTVSGNSLIKSRITWKENSYSVANNTSNVTVKLLYSRDDYQTTYGTGSWVLNINGTKHTGSSYKEISYSWIEVFSVTVTITHDSNGAKTFNMNASGSYIPGTSLEGTSCSGSGTLTTIPRASTFDSVTSSVDLGAKATIKITAKASSFYHKAIWTCGSSSVTQNLGKVGQTTQKSYTYTIPTAWASQISTATSKTASVKIQTYSDSGYKTAVGSAITKSFTVVVPNTSTYKPSVSFAVSMGDKTGLGNYYVQGKTSITLNASSGKAGSGATIKSYTFRRRLSGASSYTTLKTTTTTATSASTKETTSTTGSIEYSVVITDSRNRTASGSVTVTVYPYSNPTLTVNNLYRAVINKKVEENEEVEGESTETVAYEYARSDVAGTYAVVKATFGGASIKPNGTELNTTTCTVKYKPISGTAWADGFDISSRTEVLFSYLRSVVSDLETEYETYGADGGFSQSQRYTVWITVTDTVGTVVKKELTIQTVFVTMDFKDGGRGVAFGKISEEDNVLDVGMKLKVRDEFSAPKSIIHGHVNISTVANTPTSVVVNWSPTGTLARSPDVIASPYSGVPGSQVVEVSVGERSTTGCTLWIYRTNAADMRIDYIAMA